MEVGAGQVKGVLGQQTTLHCEVEGTPTPEVTWYRGLLPLATGGGGTLLLSPVTHADGGVYTCVAENAVGVAAANLTLVVLGERRRAPPTLHDTCELPLPLFLLLL